MRWFMARGWLRWFVGYVALLLATVWGLTRVREWTLRELSTPAANQSWQDWKQAESQRQAQTDEPVRRRIPRSGEPPALILMRESFPVIVVTCGAMATFLYGFLVVLVRGSLRTGRRKEGWYE